MGLIARINGQSFAFIQRSHQGLHDIEDYVRLNPLCTVSIAAHDSLEIRKGRCLSGCFADRCSSGGGPFWMPFDVADVDGSLSVVKQAGRTPGMAPPVDFVTLNDQIAAAVDGDLELDAYGDAYRETPSEMENRCDDGIKRGESTVSVEVTER